MDAVAGSLFGLGLVVAGTVVAESWAQWRAEPVAARAALITSSLLLPALVLAVPVSLVVARRVGRAHYSRVVRPHLLAWPPRDGAKAARCRVCSGDLPSSSERLVSCRYCHSESVVGPELFERPSRAPSKLSTPPPRAPDLAGWVRLAMLLSFVGTLLIAGCLLWLAYYYGATTIH